jgi:hypothetical protein
MVTGSITATIIHGESTYPPGALDWSLGDFTNTFAVSQVSLFLASLYLYKAVSVSGKWFARAMFNCKYRHQNPKRTLKGVLSLYRLTGVLPRF